MNIVKIVLGALWKSAKEFHVQSSGLLGFIYAWVTYSGMTKIVLGWLTLIWLFGMLIIAMFVKSDE